jgi:hypothetical protein
MVIERSGGAAGVLLSVYGEAKLCRSASGEAAEKLPIRGVK